MEIKSLQYIPNFITQEEEGLLLTAIDKNPWLHDLKRRVQHYGYKYDYKARKIDDQMSLGELPKWVDFLLDKFAQQNIFNRPPEQLIINEYEPGQGISKHIDCPPCFDDTIVSLSLLSGINMNFHQQEQQHSLRLEPCSLLVLKGESRYYWRHSIAARKTDIHNHQKIKRSRRISLTFRNILLE